MKEITLKAYGKLNLTYPQSVVLCILDCDGPMPISALAEAAGSANSTISGVVDRLEKMGLVKRVRSDADRRVIYVATTESFQAHHRKVKSNTVNRLEEILGGLSEQEVQTVRDGLALLSRALQDYDP